MYARADRGVPLVGFAVLLACGLQAGALVRGTIGGFVAVAAILGVAEATAITSEPAGQVAVVAGGLLLATELACWSTERRTAMTADVGVDARRWLLLAVLVPLSMAAALVLLIVAASSRTASGALPVLGTASAVAVVALIAFGVRRTSTSRAPRTPRTP